MTARELSELHQARERIVRENLVLEQGRGRREALIKLFFFEVDVHELVRELVRQIQTIGLFDPIAMIVYELL